MRATIRSRLRIFAASGFIALASGLLALFTIGSRDSQAGIFGRCRQGCEGHSGDIESFGDVGGTWYWMRSPEEEKRVVMGLFNRYCIRCHGVDGRGVWDIPDVPDFTNGRWQSSRSDGQLARSILEGLGAVSLPSEEQSVWKNPGRWHATCALSCPAVKLRGPRRQDNFSPTPCPSFLLSTILKGLKGGVPRA